MDARTFFPAHLNMGAGRLIMCDRPDTRSSIWALAAATLVTMLAAGLFPDHNGALPAIGLCAPNALATVFLLRARLRNEWIVLGAIGLASVVVHIASGAGTAAAILLALANVLHVLLATALTRYWCGPAEPDMKRLVHLGWFIWAGGVIAPAGSAILVSLAIGSYSQTIWPDAITWAMSASLAMILIVPPSLLVWDARSDPRLPPPVGLGETTALCTAGMICTFLVFRQPALLLLFLIYPITLLHACRLSTRGTAVYLLAVALIATVMTLRGIGPIAATGSSGMEQSLVLQLVLAANMLTGLPVAILLGSRALMITELAEGKRQLDMLANNIGDAVLHYDFDQVCTYASPSVRDVLGAPVQDYIGQSLDVGLHPDALEAACAVVARLLSGQAEHERLTFRRCRDADDGTPVYVEADCTAVREAGAERVTGIVMAVRDVTERIVLADQLTEAREQAEQGAQLKSDFLANMSHEIRTPMNGVLGFAEMMLQGELQPDQRRFAELIVRSGRSMMLLLNDVLDLSKIEAGQFTIDEGPVDLHATLSECAALHRLDAEKKGIDLIFSYDCPADGDDQRGGHMNHWIITDGLRLRQIVLNLLSNAVKFTETGTIRLSCQMDADTINIMVEDTGIGINAARLQAIFDPFNQSEGDIARRFGGTGLGLSISRKLADLLGGCVTVVSSPSAGSCFTLALPARLVPPHVPAAPRLPAAASVDLPPRARILLAEDHEVNRLLMGEMLERCGQTVATAYDGTEAISMVIDSIMRGHPYDLVLMDVQMPGCDGYSAARAIRGSGIGPDMLPIIALTANAFPGDVATARASGMQGHLAKPITMSELARALQRWLPSRIVEAAEDDRIGNQPHIPTIPRISDSTAAQWIASRQQVWDAIAKALAKGNVAPSVDDALQGRKLLLMIHNLAGTAALFGEAALGDCAAALEEALRKGAGASACEALAHDLLAMLDQPAREISEAAE